MKKGFTLIELIIVIVIIAILSVIAIPRYFSQIENARKSEAYATMRAIREAQMGNFAAGGSYATSFPISVNISGGAQPDIYLAEPKSPNFTYSTTASCITAAKAGGSTTSYYMSIDSGEVSASGCP